jgi:cytochrome P450
LSALRFDPRLPAYKADPWGAYRNYLAQTPVFQNPDGSWVVASFEAATRLLADRRRVRKRPDLLLRAFPTGDFRDHNANTMTFMDPPDHTRVRRAMAHAFTPGAIDYLQARIEQIAVELLDALEDRSSFDLVEDFAQPLPLFVICEMLGVPPDERPRFKVGAAAVVAGLEPGASAETLEAANTAVRELTALMSRYMEARSGGGGADILSLLLGLGQEDTLSPSELIHQAIFLLNAGHETTTTLIGSGAWALLQDDAARARLQSEPELYPKAVDELLRLYPPLHFTYRRAAERIELDDQVIEPGALLVILLAAANRDPAEFPEPDRLEIDRPNAKRHLAFAAGPHTCLGNNLARMEASIALRRLFERFTDLRLAGDPVGNRGLIFQGFTEIAVARGPSSPCARHPQPAQAHA